MIKNSDLLKEWGRLGVFAPLKNMPYPDEEATKAELMGLLELQKTVTPERLAYCKRIDTDLYDAMSELLGVYGIRESKHDIEKAISDYDPIIDYLKIVYNRPRPFQTAGAFGIPLYPLMKTDASDSSYPSGHTLLALFFHHFDYVQTALDNSDLLDQDGIVGVNSDIEIDDIEFYEED